MKNRVRWECIYPNPPEILRSKWYNIEINGDTVIVYGDGLDLEYTVSQFKEFFVTEVGKIEDLFVKKVEIKK